MDAVMTLLRSVLLSACSLGFTMLSGSRSTADEAEDKAVAFVEKLGGCVIRDATKPGKPVIEVRLATKDAVKDADLKEESLTELVLSETKVTAAGVKELQTALPK